MVCRQNHDACSATSPEGLSQQSDYHDISSSIIARTSKISPRHLSRLSYLSPSVYRLQSAIKQPIISHIIARRSLARFPRPGSTASDYHAAAGPKTGNTIKTRSRGPSFQYRVPCTPVLSLSGFVKFDISQSARAFPAAPRTNTDPLCSARTHVRRCRNTRARLVYATSRIINRQDTNTLKRGKKLAIAISRLNWGNSPQPRRTDVLSGLIFQPPPFFAAAGCCPCMYLTTWSATIKRLGVRHFGEWSFNLAIAAEVIETSAAGWNKVILCAVLNDHISLLLAMLCRRFISGLVTLGRRLRALCVVKWIISQTGTRRYDPTKVN